MTKISDAEQIIMEALWKQNPQTAHEVVAETAEPNGWSDATVRTLLNRLLKKEAISAEKVNRQYLYRPLLECNAFVKTESQKFLGRFFDGKLAPFVSQFVGENGLKEQDITELKQLLKDIEDAE